MAASRASATPYLDSLATRSKRLPRPGPALAVYRCPWRYGQGSARMHEQYGLAMRPWQASRHQVFLVMTKCWMECEGGEGVTGRIRLRRTSDAGRCPLWYWGLEVRPPLQSTLESTEPTGAFSKLGKYCLVLLYATGARPQVHGHSF